MTAREHEGIGTRHAPEHGLVVQRARERDAIAHPELLEDVLEKPVKVKRFEALQFARSLSKRIQRDAGKYDVVNLHAPCGCVYGVWRWIFGKADAPPYVLTMQGSEERYVHAMRIEDRKGRAWNFSWMKCSKARTA